MSFYDILYDNKEKMGKILFAISILIFAYMFFSPLTRTYIHIDEHFVVNLLNLPFNDFMAKTMVDVHPPLYYFINLAVGFVLSLFSIPVDYFKISKILSICSYGALLLISLIKIEKDYSYFEAGLFTFIIATISGFFIQFVTIRGYCWEVTLLVLAVLYLKDVLFESDTKSWIKFIVITMICAYTHYLLVISVGVMYLIIIGNIIINKMDNLGNEIKKVIGAIIASIIIYSPALYTLTITTSYGHANGGKLNSLFDLISVIGVNKYQSMEFNILILKVITLILVIAIVYIAIKKYKISPEKENRFVIVGLLVYFLTLLIGYFIMPLMNYPLSGKYILPITGVFWLAATILLGRIENKKIFSILLVVIILLCVVGMAYTIMNETPKLYQKGIDEENTLDMINNENSVVIYQYGNVYHNYHNKLNNTKEYALGLQNIPYKHNVIIEKNISKIIDDNPGKDIYIVKPVQNKKDTNFGKDISATTIFDKAYTIIHLEKK